VAEPDLTERQPHDEAEELLPWYATGRLDASERARVEAHLSSCASCRRQLTLERQLIDEFQTMTPEIESGWARLRSRIQAPPAIPAQPKRPNAFAELWALLSKPAVIAFAVAELAFVVVAGSVLLSLSRPTYRTLGSAPAPVSANVIVIFRGNATENQMSTALKSAGASMVDGPTPAGAYLLHVVPQQRQSAVARLQSNGVVQMAQPIDGGQP
jgi:anti-sigma-K factor RskA